jgi:hypothetical protein
LCTVLAKACVNDCKENREAINHDEQQRAKGIWRGTARQGSVEEGRLLLSAIISESPLRTLGGTPQGIVSDPDDRDVWVALPDTIEQINPSTDTIAQAY